MFTSTSPPKGRSRSANSSIQSLQERKILVHTLPLPKLPPIPFESPQIVRVMDEIRARSVEDDDLMEFYWFAREYPRVYRHHVDHAALRLRLIHDGYVEFHNELSDRVRDGSAGLGMAISNRRVSEVYWDFEALLNAVSSSLDVLTRVVGPAYELETPLSFRKFVRKHLQGQLWALFNAAHDRWVWKLKDYRDCFVHFTAPETLLCFDVTPYVDGWEVRAPIPRNPNERDILGFRKGRRHDVLKYASTVWRHLMALDRAVAKELRRMSREGRFPVRTAGLFFKGRRVR